MSWLSRIFGTRKSKYVSPKLVEQPVVDHRPADVIEKEDRRQRSETRLRGEGIPISPDLPDTETISELQLRKPREVADRLLALTLVAMKADGMDHEVMLEIVRERDARKLLTPKETAFIDAAEPSDADRARYLRRFESAWTLIWALRLVREPLTTPREACDIDRLIGIVRDTPDLSAYNLRDACSILDKLDLFMRYDWAVRHCREKGLPLPVQFNGDAAMERFRALAWLTCQRDWDEPGRNEMAA